MQQWSLVLLIGSFWGIACTWHHELADPKEGIKEGDVGSVNLKYVLRGDVAYRSPEPGPRPVESQVISKDVLYDPGRSPRPMAIEFLDKDDVTPTLHIPSQPIGKENSDYHGNGQQNPPQSMLSKKHQISKQIKDQSVLITKLNVLEEETSLKRLLVEILETLKDCGLLVAYDSVYEHSTLLKEILDLPFRRQVVRVSSAEDMDSVLWGKSSCQAYLFLLGDYRTFLAFNHVLDDSWDYEGRFLLVGISLQDLEVLCSSGKGKKTKHVLGILKTGEGDWAVYMNLLYKAQPLTRLTTWRNGSFTSQKPLFPDKLNDLGGVVVKVVTFEWKPSTFNQLGRDGEVEDRFGVDIEVVRAVAKVLNFNIEFVEPPQGELWGSRMPNGSWNGMMGLLHRAEAEIAAANLYVTSRRLSVLEYTDPYDSELSCFLTRTEPPLPRWHALAFPFHLWTWLALLLSLLATGPVFYLLARNSCHVPGEAKDTHSLPFAYTYVFGVHCSRSMALLPRSPSTRVFVVFLWLYAVILTIAYSTNLTAFLIVTTSPAGVETIRELYESGKEVAGTGYFYRDELASSGDPFLQGLTDRYLSSTTVDEILKKVVSGGTVYLQNRGSLEYVRATKFSSRTLQGVRIMKECFAPYSIALAVQRHSPLKEKISRAVGHLQSGGLARQYFLQSLRRAAASEGREGSELTLGDAAEGDESSEDVIPLTLDHLQGVFMLALLGWGLSCFVLLAECVL